MPKLMMRLAITFLIITATVPVVSLAQQPSAKTDQGAPMASKESQSKDSQQSAAVDKVYRVKIEKGAPDWWQRASILIAISALATSLYFSWAARRHNRLSVRPFPFILQPDFEEYIAVKIENNGSGPMILHSAQATHETNSGHLIDLVPKPPTGMFFSNFNRIEQVRAIRAGQDVILLEISINEKNPAQVAYRDDLRRALGAMTLTLEYTDIYNTHFPPYSRTMDWFARHFKKAAGVP